MNKNEFLAQQNVYGLLVEVLTAQYGLMCTDPLAGVRSLKQSLQESMHSADLPPGVNVDEAFDMQTEQLKQIDRIFSRIENRLVSIIQGSK